MRKKLINLTLKKFLDIHKQTIILFIKLTCESRQVSMAALQTIVFTLFAHRLQQLQEK